MATVQLSGNLVDIEQEKIFPATLTLQGDRLVSIEREEGECPHQYLLPGFVDAHVHIESSLLVPTEFARLATVHGTVAAVSDPHEIANILGVEGVRYLLANAAQTPFQFAFGVPSCVPATPFETAGATLGASEIAGLFEQEHLTYLSEVMDFPGVLAREGGVMEKIEIARRGGHPIDGHAPGLRGEEARRYAGAGITTDHECVTLEEAREKVALGMKILIREGSAAKNYWALHPLLASDPRRCMFCSDDKHPNDLVRGHINELVRRSVALGYDVMEVLRAACINPVEHYGLKVGRLRPGDRADLIAIDDLHGFRIHQTYCQGILCAQDGKSLLPSLPVEALGNFQTDPKKPEDFRLPALSSRVRVMQVHDGQLFTTEQTALATVENGEIVAAPERDILKVTVVNRYRDTPPAVALVQNFGLLEGAIASSVAHDSHNIVAVGTTDAELCRAVNAVIGARGGLVVARGEEVKVLPLAIAGLMGQGDGYRVARDYAELEALAKQLGSKLSAPLMTLSFLALLVIPELKLSDLGLFNGKDFTFVSLYVD